jgi:hypothetical protein
MRRSRINWRKAGVVLMVAALALFVAPIGLRSAAAQDSLDIQTRVMILHASPDLGKVEVFINNEEVLDEFEYGDQSEFIDFEPGGPRVTITADRAGFNYAVFDATYPAPAGNDYYLIISDALVLGGVFDRTPVPDGGARVQIVQGSVALPAVNVEATGANVSFATQLAYGRTSESQAIPAGTYDIAVTLADTGEEAVTQTGVALDGNSSNVLVIMGEPGDEDHPLEVRALVNTTTEDGGTPTP